MKLTALTALLVTTLYTCLPVAPAQAADIQHVLMVSVDGMHALDQQRFIATYPKSALAQLAHHGVTYTNARTPANSDSFPGLLALVTGGSPVSHGVFYDVSYDRTYFANGDTTCSGAVVGAVNGTVTTAGKGSTTAFDESIDLYDTSNPAAAVSLNVIDPKALPYRLNVQGQCVPVYPHDLLQNGTNTLFEVVKAHGGVTAWADKHPAYDLVNGPSGHGVDDLYTPEITNVNGFDSTVSVVCTAANDRLKVNGILNQIRGLSHDGKRTLGVPTVFGMNFQAVSVGQKLAHDNTDNSCTADTQLSGQPGGYLDGAGTPTPVLDYGLRHTDAALGEMIDALKQAHLYESTLFIVTAKHGQSPINPALVNKPGHFADLVAALVPTSPLEAAAQATFNIAANCSAGPCGFVQDDDVALVWLQDQSKTASVAALLNAHAQALFIEEVLAGPEATLRFNDPLTNSRTPDLVIQPKYGTIYTGSTKKNAEHGGFSFGDTNVALLVSNPQLAPTVIKTPVVSSSVAPSVLRVLGISPNELVAVQREHTPVLPALFGDR